MAAGPSGDLAMQSLEVKQRALLRADSQWVSAASFSGLSGGASADWQQPMRVNSAACRVMLTVPNLTALELFGKVLSQNR